MVGELFIVSFIYWLPVVVVSCPVKRSKLPASARSLLRDVISIAWEINICHLYVDSIFEVYLILSSLKSSTVTKETIFLNILLPALITLPNRRRVIVDSVPTVYGRRFYKKLCIPIP